MHKLNEAQREILTHIAKDGTQSARQLYIRYDSIHIGSTQGVTANAAALIRRGLLSRISTRFNGTLYSITAQGMDAL